MIYAADAAHDIQPLRVCMICYPSRPCAAGAYHPFRHGTDIIEKSTLKRAFFVVGRGGFEPPKSLTADLQSAPFGHSGTYPYAVVSLTELELVDGLEPPTC